MKIDQFSVIEKHWQNLTTIIQHSPLSGTLLLKQPAPASLPTTQNVRQLQKQCTSLHQRQLLHRHIFSATILFQGPNDQKEELQRLYGHETIFPMVSLNEIQHVSWIAVPFAVVQGNTPVKVYCFLGLKAGDGKCIVQSSPQMDSSSRKALQSLVPDDKDLFVWTVQHESDSPLTGYSLALPAAIGIALLEESKVWPSQLLATGALLSDGNVTAVGHIQKKKQLLPKGNGLFLVPAENQPHDIDGDSIAVRTVHEAVSVVKHLHTGINDSKTIRRFQFAAQDVDTLLGTIDTLPIEFFVLYDLSTVYETINNNPEKYIAKITSCLKIKSTLSPLPDVLVNMFSCDDIWNIAQRHPFQAIEYCLAQLSFQNHYGHTDKSHQWSCLADRITSSCDAKKELSPLANNDFVNSRFNRYDFRVELPDLFQSHLKHEQQLHELQRDDSKQLGAMYGTLAQNYGFCGSSYLKNLEEMAEKSIAAFGNRFVSERPRIQTYLLYGYLDNSNFTQANTLFSKILSLPDTASERWIQKINAEYQNGQPDFPFTLTTLCRILADQPDLLDSCSWKNIRKEFSTIVVQKNQHPWQLTAVNLARCCLHYNETEQAITLINHSISVCLQHGATMRAMALLPLALLHQHNLTNKTHINLAEKLVKEIKDSNLQQSHFVNLFHRDGRSILATVHERKKTIFPFTYR